MKRFCLILTASFLFLLWPSLSVMGQKMIFKPSKYILPTQQTTTSQDGDAPVRGKLWFVYGDRPYINTTSSPGSGSQVKTLSFGDIYCVVEEKDEYLHIFKDPNVNYRGELSANRVDYGWVNKKDVLLWEHCLVTDDGAKLPRKAMVLNTVNSLKEESFEKLESGRVNYYQDPGRKIPTGRSSGLFQIYFVYKFDPQSKSVLIGKDNFFDRGGQTIIVGWVSQDRIVMWDQRVALEPNPDIKAAEERKGKSHPAAFYFTRQDATNYMNTGTMNQTTKIWSDDSYGVRRQGEYRRFPILGGQISNGIAKVGVMGDINSSHAKMSAQQMATLQEKFTAGKAEKRNVDIVFVVDATKSMEPHYRPIANALKNSVQEILLNSGDKNQYRFGAMVYRDAAEGKYVLESQKLTSNSNLVSTFLQQVPNGNDVKNRNDRDQPEAVYYGLMSALRGLGMTKTHTNVVILVGDAGNHYRDDRTTVNQEDLIKLLEDYSCNMLVFQAQHRSSDETFNDFVSQTKHLVRKVAEDKYRSIRGEAAIANIQVKFPTWAKDSRDPNIWRLKDGSLSGSVLVSKPDTKLSPEKLQREIQRLITDIRKHHNSVLDAAEDAVMSGESIDNLIAVADPGDSESPYVSSFSAAILQFLHENNFTPDQLKMIANKSYQMFVEGYAPMRLNGHEHDMFISVLFLTRREIVDLYSEMEKLNLAVNPSDLREGMVKAWKELLGAHIGDMDREEMENMSMERVTELVFGVPTKSGLASKALKDIMDPAIVDDYLLNEYVRAINIKIDKLKKIFNSNDYPYAFVSNDVSYYWIEQSLLP